MSMRKKMLIGLGCLLAFILIVIVIILSVANEITAPISSQLKAIRNGDIVNAYSFTSQDFRSATSLKDFELFVNHYVSLKKNKNIKFTTEDIQNDTGVVNGILYSREGVSTAVEYLLVKEEGQWKILGIKVNPGDDTENADNNSHADNASEANNHSSAMTNSYDNRDSRYTIKYPANWDYEKSSDGTVIFSGKRGTPAFFSTVNIQTVLTKKTGGDFTTVKEFMADIKHQAVSQSPGVKFLESGPISISEKSGVKDSGEYTTFTYTYKDKEFKQWQVVVLRHDGQVFYAWAYTSPLQQYPNDVAVAKAMLESWIIY